MGYLPSDDEFDPDDYAKKLLGEADTPVPTKQITIHRPAVESDKEFRNFFKKQGFGVNRTYGKAINKGSPHTYGGAADINIHGKTSDDLYNLMEQSLLKGYRVFDERQPAPGVKQTGPHIHVENAKTTLRKPSRFVNQGLTTEQIQRLTELEDQRRRGKSTFDPNAYAQGLLGDTEPSFDPDTYAQQLVETPDVGDIPPQGTVAVPPPPNETQQRFLEWAKLNNRPADKTAVAEFQQILNDEVAQENRVGELEQIGEAAKKGERILEMPDAPTTQATDADFEEANKYLASVKQPLLTREQFNVAQKSGQAQATGYQTRTGAESNKAVSTQPERKTAQTVRNPQETPKEPIRRATNLAVGGKELNDKQLLDTMVTYTVDLTKAKGDKNAYGQGLVRKKLMDEWGLTADQANNIIADNNVTDADKEVTYGIPRNILASYTSKDKVKADYEAEKTPIYNSEKWITEFGDKQAQTEERDVVNKVNRAIDRNMQYTADMSEGEAEKEIEKRTKDLDYSLQSRIGSVLSNPLSVMMPFGVGNSLVTPDEEFTKAEKARLLNQHGSYKQALEAEKYYQDMGYAETGVRMANETVRSFAKNLVSGTAKSAIFLSQLQEDLNPINQLLPEDKKIGLRNVGNAVDFITRLVSSRDVDTATKETNWVKAADGVDKQQLFKAIQEFDKTVGEDKVLKGRLLGSMSDATGSALAFIALGAAMPSLSTTNFWGTTRNWGQGLSGLLMSAGTGYEEGKQSGLTEDQAKSYGIAQGLLGVTEMFGAGAEMTKFLKEPGLRKQFISALMEVGQAVKRESKDEFAQEVFQTTSGKAILEYLKDNDPSTLTRLTNALNRLPKQLGDTIANEGMIATLTGGLMGGGGRAVQLANDEKVEPKVEPKVEVMVDKPIVEPSNNSVFERPSEPKKPEIPKAELEQQIKDSTAEVTQGIPTEQPVKKKKVAPVEKSVEKAEKPKFSNKPLKEVVAEGETEYGGVDDFFAVDEPTKVTDPKAELKAERASLAKLGYTLPVQSKLSAEEKAEIIDKGVRYQKPVKAKKEPIVRTPEQIAELKARAESYKLLAQKQKEQNKQEQKTIAGWRQEASKASDEKLIARFNELHDRHTYATTRTWTAKERAIKSEMEKRGLDTTLKYSPVTKGDKVVYRTDVYEVQDADGSQVSIVRPYDSVKVTERVDRKDITPIDRPQLADSQVTDRDEYVQGVINTYQKAGLDPLQETTPPTITKGTTVYSKSGVKGTVESVDGNDLGVAWDNNELEVAPTTVDAVSTVSPKARSETQAPLSLTSETQDYTFKNPPPDGLSVSRDGKTGTIQKQDGKIFVVKPDGTKAGWSPTWKPVDETMMQAVGGKQTDTPEFKKFFGKSKVVDEKGEPLVVYRGESSGDDINVFDRRKTRESGFFFTPREDIASIYARGQKPRQFYLKAENVLDLTKDDLDTRKWIAKWGKGFDDWIDRQSGEEVDPVDVVQGGRLFDWEGNWSGERWKDLIATAEYNGYDGVIAPDWDNDTGVFPSYIVFDPKQIKSAIGNKGTFDPNDPDITKRAVSELDANQESFTSAKKLPTKSLVEQSNFTQNARIAEGGVIAVDQIPEIELIRRIMGEGTQFYGVMADPNKVAKFNETLDKMIAHSKSPNLRKLKRLVNEAMKHDGTVIFAMSEETVPEEKAHRALYGNRQNNRASQIAPKVQKSIVESDVFKNAKKFQDTYKSFSEAGRVEEFAVKASLGQWNDLGITSEADKFEAMSMADDFYRSYAETNKGKLNPEQILNTLSTEIAYAQEFENYKNQEVRGDEKENKGTDANIPVEPAKGKESGNDVETSGEGKPDELKLKDGEALASFPKTLRKYGLDAIDVAYTVYGHKESTTKAIELLNKHGIDGSIKFLESVEFTDPAYTVLSGMVYDTLLNQSIDTQNLDIRKKADDFLISISRKLAKAGAIGEAVKVMQHAPVVTILANAESAAEEAGNTLTPEQVKTSTDLGHDLEENFAETQFYKKDNDRLRAELAELKVEMQAILSKQQKKVARSLRSTVARKIKETHKDEIAKAIADANKVIREMQRSDTMMMAAPSDQESLTKILSKVVAGNLVDGLANNTQYLPESAQAELEAIYGAENINPIFQDVYAEAMKLRDKWIKEEAQKRLRRLTENKLTKPEVKAEIEAQLNRELPENLSDKDILDIMGITRDTLRRQRALEQIHRYASGVRKANVTPEVRQTIATIAPDDITALGALLHAEVTSPKDFNKAMAEVSDDTDIFPNGYDQKAVDKAFVDGAEILEEAKTLITEHQLEIKQETAELSARVRDAEIAELNARERLDKTKQDIANHLYKLKHSKARYVAKRVWNILPDTLRNMTLSAEASFLMRQGGKFLRADAITWLPRMLKLMENDTAIRSAQTPIKASFKTIVPKFSIIDKYVKGDIGDDAFARHILSIENDPDFDAAVADGVDFSTAGKIGSGLKLGEEQLQSEGLEILAKWSEKAYAKGNNVSGLLKKIPSGYAKTILRFDKGMSVFLDTLRLKHYKLAARELRSQGLPRKENREEYKELANRINTGTSRPNKFKNIKAAQNFVDGAIQSKIFLAPAYTVAKWQDMGADVRNTAQSVGRAITFQGLPKGTQRIMMKRAMQSYGALVAQYAILAYITGALISFDPDDDDFLKLKWGNYRYDLTQGNRSEIRYIAKLIKHADSPMMALNSTTRYLRSRLNVLPAFATDMWTGKDLSGKTVTPSDPERYAKLFAPLAYMNAIGAYNQDGAKGVLWTLPADVFGYSAAVYPDRVKDLTKQLSDAQKKGDVTEQERLKQELEKQRPIEQKQKELDKLNKPVVVKIPPIDTIREIGSMEEAIKSPSVKRWSTDEWVLVLQSDLSDAEKTLAQDALKKKAQNARKSKTLTQDEVNRINSVLPEFKIQADDRKGASTTKKLADLTYGKGGRDSYADDSPMPASNPDSPTKWASQRQSENIIDKRNGSPLYEFENLITGDIDAIRQASFKGGTKADRTEARRVLNEQIEESRYIVQQRKVDPTRAKKVLSELLKVRARF